MILCFVFSVTYMKNYNHGIKKTNFKQEIKNKGILFGIRMIMVNDKAMTYNRVVFRPCQTCKMESFAKPWISVTFKMFFLKETQYS